MIGIFEFIFTTFREGGPFMFPIMIVSAFGLAIIIERFYYLFFKYSVNSVLFFQEIKKRLRAGRIDEAIKVCSNAPLPAIIKVGLQQIQAGGQSSFEDPRNAMGEKTLEMVPLIRKRTHYLSLIANVATLLGLLGTIIGLIIAFKAVTDVDPSMRATQLASGISIAMGTTAFGLVVAIPCMIFYALLQAKTTRILDDLDEYSVKVLHLIDDLLIKRGE